ncbi:MAG: nitroreductase family protein [Candidatus Thorarchaeota archaeon]
MNEMLTMIQSRKSIRKYSQKPIPENELKEILKTGFSAPSGGNMQPWRVVVVKDQTRKDRLATAAYGQSFIAEAPVLLVVCAVPHESAEKYKERGATLYALQDTAALTQNILLASHALGYATCWIGAFNEDEVSKIIKVPEGIRPVSMIPIGLADGVAPKGRPRKSVSDVVIEEEF